MVFYDAAPTGHGWLGADTQERQTAFNENCTRKIGRRNDYNRRHTIGQNMFNDYSEIIKPQRPGSGNILHLFYAHYLPADHTGNFYPHSKPDGDKNLPKTLPQG